MPLTPDEQDLLRQQNAAMCKVLREFAFYIKGPEEDVSTNYVLRPCDIELMAYTIARLRGTLPLPPDS